MNEPRVIESVTNECQSLGRAHESSSARAEQLIACLEGEIARRDEELAACRVAVENCELFRARIAELCERVIQLEDEHARNLDWRDQCKALSAELAAIKAQEPTGWYTEDHLDDKSATTYSWAVAERWVEKGWPVFPLYAAPVPEAKAQGEYGDAYQGAREDLAIWKRRALEADKALQEERIITERLGNALNEENGPTFMGEPVFPAKAQGVVQWPEADEIMQMAFEEGHPADDASGYYFELEEFDLFIDRLMSEVARLNAAPVQQVSVPDGFVLAKETVVEMPDGSKELGYTTIGRVGIFNSAEEVFDAIRELDLPLGWVSMTTEQLLPGWMLAAAPAAPAADAGLDYQALFDAIAAATSVYANGAVNISVQAFRDALAAHRDQGAAKC